MLHEYRAAAVTFYISHIFSLPAARIVLLLNVLFLDDDDDHDGGSVALLKEEEPEVEETENRENIRHQHAEYYTSDVVSCAMKHNGWMGERHKYSQQRVARFFFKYTPRSQCVYSQCHCDPAPAHKHTRLER